MDPKLARGMARSLLRTLEASGDVWKGPLHKTTTALMREYFDMGGIPAARLVSRGLEWRRQLAGCGPFLSSCEILRHPVRRRVLVDCIRPGVVQGSEQAWIVFGSTLFDMERDELMLVEVSGHTSIAFHGMVWLFERSAFTAADFTGLMDTVTSWTVQLLQVMGRRRCELGTEIAIPYKDGLLLGSLEYNPLRPERRPAQGRITRGKVHDHELLVPAFGALHGEGIAAIGINTYIGPQELFENQQELRLTFERFGVTFQEEFQRLRAGLTRGLPAPGMVERFNEVLERVSHQDLELLGDTLERFFATPEWKTHAEAHRRPARFLN